MMPITYDRVTWDANIEPYYSWCQEAATTAATNAATTWTTWTANDTTSTGDSWLQWTTAWQMARRTVEENGWVREHTPARVDPAVQEAARREARRKERLTKEAKQRAEELLVAHLSPEQAKEYQADRRFHVIGADGQRYRINTQRQHGNIVRVDSQGRVQEEFCIYAGGAVPLGDNALAQKLMIESNLEEFRRIANVQRVRDVAV